MNKTNWEQTYHKLEVSDLDLWISNSMNDYFCRAKHFQNLILAGDSKLTDIFLNLLRPCLGTKTISWKNVVKSELCSQWACAIENVWHDDDTSNAHFRWKHFTGKMTVSELNRRWPLQNLRFIPFYISTTPLLQYVQLMFSFRV